MVHAPQEKNLAVKSQEKVQNVLQNLEKQLAILEIATICMCCNCDDIMKSDWDQRSNCSNTKDLMQIWKNLIVK